MTLLEKAVQAVGRASTPGAEVEVYMVEGAERGIEYKEGALDGIQETLQAGTGLRLLKNGRQAFACCPGADPEVIPELLERALAQIDHLPEDEHRSLPAPEKAAPNGLSETLWDPTLFQVSLSSAEPLLKEMEAEALKDKRVTKVMRLGYGESRGEVAIANSRGMACVERGTHASVGLSVAAEVGGDLQIGSASDSRRHFADLDFNLAGRQAAERALALLNGKKPPTKRRSIVLDPWAAPEFLELLASALCADQIQRGKSMLAGKLGAPVAASMVSLVDDPLRPKGPASSLFDDEGVPARRKTLVKDGILKDYFYDVYTGRREGKPSNGSASRPSFRGVPSPGSSNFFIEPGAISREELIAGTFDGVLVLEVMGMHTADPISGEFSVGLSGVAIENGRLTHAVKGSMLSGNILDLMKNVDAIANDLTFYGSLGSPTIRVADLTVA